MAAQQEQAPERSPADGPDAPTGHSGRLLVRMPSTLHAELAQVARREGVSLNALVISALSGAVGWRSPDTARTPQGEDAEDALPVAAAAQPAAAPPSVAHSRTLSVALAVNLVVVLLAAAAAIGLVIAAWPS